MPIVDCCTRTANGNAYHTFWFSRQNLRLVSARSELLGCITCCFLSTVAAGIRLQSNWQGMEWNFCSRWPFRNINCSHSRHEPTLGQPVEQSVGHDSMGVRCRLYYLFFVLFGAHIVTRASARLLSCKYTVSSKQKKKTF